MTKKMKKHYFTPHEINALIPQLNQLFEHVQVCASRAEELAAQALRADDIQAQLLRSQVEFLMQAVQEDVNKVQQLGGITKDIEMGLVDFLGDVGGQDVWLCWKMGETAVRFWHPLDGGYSQRRALSPSSKTIH
jgi:hypothetical protein